MTALIPMIQSSPCGEDDFCLMPRLPGTLVDAGRGTPQRTWWRGVLTKLFVGLILLPCSLQAVDGVSNSSPESIGDEIARMKREIALLRSEVGQIPRLEEEVTALKARIRDAGPVEPVSEVPAPSKARKPKVRVGGRLMIDASLMDGDSALETVLGKNLETATEVRRARLFAEGPAGDHLRFRVQYDFAGNKVRLKDAFLRLDLAAGGSAWDELIVGRVKEPFGLEQLASTKYSTFIERSLPDVFTPGRNLGVAAYRTFGSRMKGGLAAGLFREVAGDGSSRGSGRTHFTARLHVAPVNEDGGRDLLHLGLSHSRVDLPGTLRFEQRPENHLAPIFADTGSFTADRANLSSFEIARVLGPISLQGEYITARVDRPGGSEASFGGYYGQVSYWLTGEHRPYDAALGVFKRVRPRSEAFSEEGGGAWEIAYRRSFLDLEAPGIPGGTLASQTLGVNWHLNAQTRFMLNYVLTKPGHLPGDAELISLRMQTDF